MKETEKLEPIEVDASITIEFSKPDENGEVKTNVIADNMSVKHFEHLKPIAQWYIDNEFPKKEK